MLKTMSKIVTPALILTIPFAFSENALAKKSVFSLPKVQKVRTALLNEDMNRSLREASLNAERPSNNVKIQNPKMSDELTLALERLRKY